MTGPGRQPARSTRERRRASLALPPGLAVVGIALLGANPALGVVFVAAALAAVAWLVSSQGRRREA